jgi:hypothetical protein
MYMHPSNILKISNQLQYTIVTDYLWIWMEMVEVLVQSPVSLDL